MKYLTPLPSQCSVGNLCSACTKTMYYDVIDEAVCEDLINAPTPTVRYTVPNVLCKKKN